MKCGILNLPVPTGPVQTYNAVVLSLSLSLHSYQFPEKLYGNDTSKYDGVLISP
jgi:hypothetical protein